MCTMHFHRNKCCFRTNKFINYINEIWYFKQILCWCIFLINSFYFQFKISKMSFLTLALDVSIDLFVDLWTSYIFLLLNTSKDVEIGSVCVYFLSIQFNILSRISQWKYFSKLIRKHHTNYHNLFSQKTTQNQNKIDS